MARRYWFTVGCVLWVLSLLSAGCVEDVANVQPDCTDAPCGVIDGVDGPVGTPLPFGRFAIATNGGAGTVSSFAIDNATGRLRTTGWVLAGNLPTAALVHVSGQFAYVTNATSDSISGYTFDPLSGGLVPIPGTPIATGGTTPNHIAGDLFGRFVFALNESSASVAAYTVDTGTGALTAFPGSPFILPMAAGPRRPAVTPDGKFLYVPGPGIGVMFGFTIDAATPALTAIPGSPFAMQGGALPTHTAVNPSSKFLYAISSGSGLVSAFAINAVTGALTELPASPFTTTASGASGLAVHPGGGFLYEIDGTGISAQRIHADGSLVDIIGTPVGVGSTSLEMAIDPGGSFAYVANNGDQEVALVSINPATGIPSLVTSYRTQAGVQSVAIAGGTAPLTFTPKFAFVVNQAASELTSFTIDPTDGTLTQVNTASDAGAIFPFGAAVHPSGKFVYAADLNTFNVSGFSVDPNTGAVAKLTNSPYPPGGLGSPNSPISLAIEPSGKYLYAVTNNDLLYYFEIDPVSGDLTLINAGTGTLGTTPNHVTVDPTGQFVYVSNTASGDITYFTIDPTSGDPINPVVESGVGTVLRSSAADPSGRYLFTGSQNSDIAEYAIGIDGSLTFIANPTITGFTGIFGIAPHPAGTHVYMAIPSSDTVAAFSIDAADGTLDLVSSSGIASVGPQGVAIEPTGRFVYSANQGTDDVTQFDVQPSGTLIPSVTVGSGGSGQPYAILTWGSFE